MLILIRLADNLLPDTVCPTVCFNLPRGDTNLLFLIAEEVIVVHLKMSSNNYIVSLLFA